jgi:hypothetical protein
MTMTATRTQSRAAPAAQKRAPARSRRQPRITAERSADVSKEILAEVEEGQRAAIKAVREFVDTVDEALPPQRDRLPQRKQVVDGALVMADKLVHVQYDFLRKVVQSAGKALGRTDDGVGKA